MILLCWKAIKYYGEKAEQATWVLECWGRRWLQYTAEFHPEGEIRAKAGVRLELRKQTREKRLS